MLIVTYFFHQIDLKNMSVGIIMYDETLRQSSLKDNSPHSEYLTSLGVIPGIKVDAGAHSLAGTEDEKITSGLDGLDERLEEYRELGARFAKWRAQN